MDTYTQGDKCLIRFYNEEPYHFVNRQTGRYEVAHKINEAWHEAEIVKQTRTKTTAKIIAYDWELVFGKDGREIKLTIFGAQLYRASAENIATAQEWQSEQDKKNAEVLTKYRNALDEIQESAQNEYFGTESQERTTNK